MDNVILFNGKIVTHPSADDVRPLVYNDATIQNKFSGYYSEIHNPDDKLFVYCNNNQIFIAKLNPSLIETNIPCMATIENNIITSTEDWLTANNPNYYRYYEIIDENTINYMGFDINDNMLFGSYTKTSDIITEFGQAMSDMIDLHYAGPEILEYDVTNDYVSIKIKKTPNMYINMADITNHPNDVIILPRFFFSSDGLTHYTPMLGQADNSYEISEDEESITYKFKREFDVDYSQWGYGIEHLVKTYKFIVPAYFIAQGQSGLNIGYYRNKMIELNWDKLS